VSARVAYLTDLEGSWDRLASFARDNPIVRFEGERLRVADDGLFVFGGDAIDRGPASRRVVHTLLEAKRRQPGRVVLLAGNRDINKLRLPRELAGHPPHRTPDEVKSGPRAALLRWIFQHTMGAPAAFEHRRHELGDAGDEDVVDSFLADLRPDGELTAYLAAAQLAFRHGSTLFVHGGLSSESLGAVPGHETIADLDAWILALNRWYDQQIDAFVSERSHEGRPGFWPLVLYQAPRPGSRLNPGSVVYGRSADEENNLRLPGAEVVERLRAAGIARAVVGHTPSGDSPSLGRPAGGGFVYVMADNSHARHPEASRVYFDDRGVEVDARTRLDGEEGLYAVRFRVDDADGETPIGLRRRDGRLIRGRLEDERWLTYRALPEWKNEQRAIEQVEREELEAPE
jgi:hypothetical protein